MVLLEKVLEGFVGKFLESLALLTCDRIDRLPRLVVELNALSRYWAIPFRGPSNLPLMTNPRQKRIEASSCPQGFGNLEEAPKISR